MEAALIALIGAVVGIILTNGIKIYLDVQDRRERMRDLQTALRAEIRSQRRGLESFDNPDQGQAIVELIASSSYVPLTPRKANPFLFEAIKGEVHILPGSVIDPIVLYYGQYASIQTFIDKIRSPQYAALAPDRQAKMFADYLRVGRDALDFADAAISAIDASLARNG